MNNTKRKQAKSPIPPDANAELVLLRKRLLTLRASSLEKRMEEYKSLRRQIAAFGKAKPSFETLMEEYKKKDAELEALEKRIAALYPELCPHCGYCATPFSRGGHSSCCGGF